MLTITSADYQKATGLHPRAVSLHLEQTAFTQVGRQRRYALGDVLPLLRMKYVHAARPLLAAATEDGSQFVGGDEVLGECTKLEAWFLAHVEGAAHRLYQARTSFFDGLGRAVRSSGLTGDSERLRLLLLRDSAILPFALTASRDSLPGDWPAWSRRFAILHSARVPLASELAA